MKFPGKFCKPIVGYDVMKISRDIVNHCAMGTKLLSFLGDITYTVEYELLKGQLLWTHCSLC
jgi:hypothetical protein